MSFREASPGVVGEKRAMVEGGRAVVEGAPKQKLAEGAGNEVCAAHNFSNVKQHIIKGGSELVGGEAILAPHQKIAKHLAGNGLLEALASIIEAQKLSLGDAEAPVDVEVLLGENGGRSWTAMSVVNWLFINGMRSI